MRTRMVAFCTALVLVLTIGVATATGGDGGNSANAKACQKGGWQRLYPSRVPDRGPFRNQGDCVSHLAHGGLVVSKSQHDCVAGGGTFSTNPSTNENSDIPADKVLWTCNRIPFATGSSLISGFLFPDCFNDGGFDLWNEAINEDPWDSTCHKAFRRP